MIRKLLPGLAASIAACAANTGPIIDTKGVDMQAYQRDLGECQAYSEQISTAKGVAKGAAGGAAVGAATGAISGNPGKGAGYGAIFGGAASARLNEREKSQVVKNCLRGRGYRVLN
ncbi:MAG: glycine zipper family protein [Gammaproteobacteria bacterium]|nr:MAG: glycine zipper family protein [Gammaproteobacteria bacterium]